MIEDSATDFYPELNKRQSDGDLDRSEIFGIPKAPSFIFGAMRGLKANNMNNANMISVRDRLLSDCFLASDRESLQFSDIGGVEL